jgi:hypothetical protein
METVRGCIVAHSLSVEHWLVTTIDQQTGKHTQADPCVICCHISCHFLCMKIS